MYPQRANIPLQGLDRCALTAGARSGPHCQIGVLHWHHFTNCGFTWLIGKKHSAAGKADQSKLASGGSEYTWLFVALSWGNKIVCKHVEFLLRQSHIICMLIQKLYVLLKCFNKLIILTKLIFKVATYVSCY